MNIYNTAGEALGEIYDVMLDKRSGRIAYAIMSFGGFLGIGEQYHPLPWANLKYDANQGCYVVGLTREQLERRRLQLATSPSVIVRGSSGSTTTTRPSRTGFDVRVAILL